jgi:serpin B
MVVLLPEPGVTTADLTEALDAENWETWFVDSYMARVQIRLPKFKYGFKALLNDPLTNLGLEIAFTQSADFTRITPPGGIFISRVIHQSCIDVQEEGTEAAAATIVEMIKSPISTIPEGPIRFVADRPFLYVIKENSTGALLFMGKAGKPEYGTD